MPHVLNPWFERPQALWLVALVPALGLLAYLARLGRRRALVQLGTLPALLVLARGRGAAQLLGSFRRTALLVVLAVAVAGPRWGKSAPTGGVPGRDLVVVLDLSRSMLAQDVLPDRLGRAREALADLSRSLQQRGGHRLALVTFAAGARVDCPLTHDFDHFRAVLADLDPAAPHPDLRPTGQQFPSGTRLGAGLQAALELHDPRYRGAQDVLLLSDGDDPAGDDEWRTAAAEARSQSVPVHTLGVGDPDRDSPIPLDGGRVVRQSRKDVTTRLREPPLREIARLSGGEYLPARTRTVDLGDWFRARVEPGPSREDSADTLPAPVQRPEWFLLPALGCLTLDLLLGRRRRGGARP